MLRPLYRGMVALLLPAIPVLAQDPPSDSPTTQEAPAVEEPPVPDQPPDGDGQCDRARLYGAGTEETTEGLIHRIKNPVPWLSWGFDVRGREIYIDNGITLDKRDADHEWHWQRQRVRLWSKITPFEGFEFNVRAAWEGKHFDRPLSFENWRPASGIWDLLNFKWSDIDGTGLTIQAGRQDLMLGDRWLVMDGAPLVGSSRMSFDAVRVSLDLEDADTKLELIYLEQDAEEDNWFKPFIDEGQHILEHDETGIIVWLTNKSLPKTQLDGYFIYTKRTPALPNGDLAEIYTFGLSADHQFTDRLKLHANAAGQFGRKNEQRHTGLGAISRLTYQLDDSWRSALRLDYEFLSGDRPGTDANEAFDVLWGRWARFSDMYIYTYAGETRISEIANLHRVSFGWTGHPHEKIELCADYHLLFADQTTFEELDGFSRGGCFRGQLITSVLKYRLTDQVTGHLQGEVLFPGDYYSNERNDVATFLRAQLVFSF